MSKDMGNVNLEELLAKMSQEIGGEPKPMKYLAQLRPDMVFKHARSKQFAASGQAIPEKYKALISVAVAAALGSESCTLTQAKIARRRGANRRRNHRGANYRPLYYILHYLFNRSKRPGNACPGEITLTQALTLCQKGLQAKVKKQKEKGRNAPSFCYPR